MLPAEPLARSTWTKDHRYLTLFRQTMNANITALKSSLETGDFTLQGLSALLAEQDRNTSNNDGALNEFQHFAFAATGNDTLHHEQVRKDHDRSFFEVDMQCDAK